MIILSAENAAFLILAVVFWKYSQNTLKHVETYLRTSLPLTPCAVAKLSITYVVLWM